MSKDAFGNWDMLMCACVDLILVFCLFFLFQLDGACGDGAGGLGFFPWNRTVLC